MTKTMIASNGDDKRMNCTILEKGRTERNATYYVLDVETPEGHVNATYFGNTTPEYVTGLREYKDGYIASIQPHVSRDRDTGRYKGGYRTE